MAEGRDILAVAEGGLVAVCQGLTARNMINMGLLLLQVPQEDRTD